MTADKKNNNRQKIRKKQQKFSLFGKYDIINIVVHKTFFVAFHLDTLISLLF